MFPTRFPEGINVPSCTIPLSLNNWKDHTISVNSHWDSNIVFDRICTWEKSGLINRKLLSATNFMEIQRKYVRHID